MLEHFQARGAPVETEQANENKRGLRELERAFENAITCVNGAAGILGRHMALRYQHIGEHRKAIAVLERLVETFPQDGRIMYQLAGTRFAAGDVEGANEAYLRSADFALKNGDYGLLSLLKNHY